MHVSILYSPELIAARISGPDRRLLLCGESGSGKSTLASHLPSGLLLVDAPGMVRGVAGAELLTGLVEAAGIDTVLVLSRHIDTLPVASELATSGCELVFVQPSARAHPPGKRQRAMQRSRMWDEYLHQAQTRALAVPTALLTGAPPPRQAFRDWQGRQIGLLKGGRTLAMGEILEVSATVFRIRAADFQECPDQFLVRDAYRDGQGLLATCKPKNALRQRSMPPDVAPYVALEKSAGPVLRIGDATAILVNGVFGDPLVHLRLHNRKRSLLFDLGDGGRLSARLAHQVTDVFISHAHIDHICGFLWLLRSRIGVLTTCRLFGPPGLADHIANLINGIHWDRIGESGPSFAVSELHDDHLVVYGLQAGKSGRVELASRLAPSGLLLDDAECRVRAVTLAHGAIPVLAYGLELPPKLNVIKERLGEACPAGGPWLGELKKRLAAGDRQALIRLPDGSQTPAGQLADELLQITPASKLVYATDLSDTAANRDKLLGLAKGAHTLFCEAGFLEVDRKYGELSGHLTARACGEIGQAARAELLVPFHFSRRYEDDPRQVFAEVAAAGDKIVALGDG
ncbi:MAG: hypothetical protein HY885_01975 [Deltaproteobacteria bacterium]|nr:hypothetical protein [Deltaproteobacteria bacterium]